MTRTGYSTPATRSPAESRRQAECSEAAPAGVTLRDGEPRSAHLPQADDGDPVTCPYVHPSGCRRRLIQSRTALGCNRSNDGMDLLPRVRNEKVWSSSPLSCPSVRAV